MGTDPIPSIVKMFRGIIVVSSNVNGRDLGSVIREIRDRVKQQVQLPAGYFIEYGGQFEAQEGATKTLFMTGLLALVGITLILYFAVKSIPATIMILINLPLALIGGVISIRLNWRYYFCCFNGRIHHLIWSSRPEWFAIS